MKYVAGGRAGLGLWMLMLVALPAISNAQGVVLATDAVRVKSSSGLTKASMGYYSSTTVQFYAGGFGTNSMIRLYNSESEQMFSVATDGDVTISGHADLKLGGRVGDDGDLHILDTDGVTTTIDLEGRLGLLTLGAVGEDGDIYVNDDAGERTFQVNGQTGDVTNALEGNGLIKGWAYIDTDDGSVIDCWRCSSSERVGEGVTRIRFSELGDIRGRPRVVSIYESHTWDDLNVYYQTRDSTTFSDAVVVEMFEYYVGGSGCCGEQDPWDGADIVLVIF